MDRSLQFAILIALAILAIAFFFGISCGETTKEKDDSEAVGDDDSHSDDDDDTGPPEDNDFSRNGPGPDYSDREPWWEPPVADEVAQGGCTWPSPHYNVGSKVANFTIKDVDGVDWDLYELLATRPVVIEFGSYT